MRKPVLDNVEIVEPPIGELTKQRGSFKKTCLTGCGCMVFFIVLALVGLRLYVGSGPEKIKSIPSNFPTDIPVYEKDAIESITYISGKYKKRTVEIAAFFPKVILSPLLLELRHDASSTSTGFFSANRNFWELLTAPVGDERNTIEIEWANMDAEPRFVVSYYKKELEKTGYTVSEIASDNGSYNISFENNRNVSGALFAEGDEQNRPGTDFASLTVNIPPDFENPPTSKK